MKTWTDKDIEKLIRDSAFPNPSHKEALRARLFEETLSLGPEDLDMAVGGQGLPEANRQHHTLFERRNIMEKQNVEEVLKQFLTGEKQELGLDELDGVAGGTMTPSDINTLNAVLKMAKQSGLSMKEVLGYVDQYYDMYHSMYPNVTKEEVVRYIKQHWNSL